jgi:hypothetical protein
MMFRFESDPLECPKCGGNNLHQGWVEVYFRREDEDVCALTLVEGSVVRVDMSAPSTDCPSPRRHGLRIKMECEQCGPAGSVAIIQHKGCTYIEWESVR